MRVRPDGGGLSPGARHGRLTVTGYQWHEKKYWRCVAKCDCGTIGVFFTHCIGKTTYSCGCLTRELQAVRAANAVKTKEINGYIAPASKRNKVCERCFCLYRGRTDHLSRFCSMKCRRPNGRRSHTCLQCENVFTDSRSFAKFCSVSCHDIHQTGPRRNLTCLQCENEFTASHDHGKWPSYCSRDCFLHDVRTDQWDTRAKMIYIGDRKAKGEHRLIIETAIGRPLEYAGEPVLHLNGNKRDNRLENLFLFPSYEAMGDAFQNGNMPSESNMFA